MSPLAPFFYPGILFVFTLAFGLWLSHLGKPYRGLLFNAHKLVALAAVVVMVIGLSKALPEAGSPALLIALLVLGAICVLALFASGALMSAGKLDYTLLRTIHRITPVALVIAMASAGYLLAGKP